jgi:hypothetical protein
MKAFAQSFDGRSGLFWFIRGGAAGGQLLTSSKLEVLLVGFLHLTSLLTPFDVGASHGVGCVEQWDRLGGGSYVIKLEAQHGIRG